MIGVDDTGNALGIETEKFANEDKMNLHLIDIIKERLGARRTMDILPCFSDFDGERALLVDREPGHATAYLNRKTAPNSFL